MCYFYSLCLVISEVRRSHSITWVSSMEPLVHGSEHYDTPISEWMFRRDELAFSVSQKKLSAFWGVGNAEVHRSWIPRRICTLAAFARTVMCF